MKRLRWSSRSLTVANSYKSGNQNGILTITLRYYSSSGTDHHNNHNDHKNPHEIHVPTIRKMKTFGEALNEKSSTTGGELEPQINKNQQQDMSDDYLRDIVGRLAKEEIVIKKRETKLLDVANYESKYFWRDFKQNHFMRYRATKPFIILFLILLAVALQYLSHLNEFGSGETKKQVSSTC